ncbi:CTP synthetase [Helicobacter cinaedi PAGU611]|uniref:CTP synthase n=1 Tax=Helicobacter cinaedi CCUG 18818 = ATCC BAA-847 TaxID=537971 RepID=A0AAI8MLV7_9HELI|nr:CTP synthase (glutamine hydrolyzing) [Helicobacter cinaedi]AWK61266.1 CTP synthase (glutamine hydrolyzing) [Helicobacter cinaedi]EFR47180.1 CTP synthase [Helicobacter cinaedi CCUG 18818 = ATCC BAA-847]QOQ90149.1 CTP synthase (glutamine hydrolyzing) [Helicobacter cinaedi]QOQ96333.1 CTP synthase (glutamine hydrolyzing) [Helicobacter cinaedi]BAM11730.1 CTP synthetase [Helicobacter cinaedi PAGU611]
MAVKYIFVTGGVLSSLGKGITSSSIATLLQHSGFDVSILKIDPYINVDPGTMSPLEHGEVFVTCDGAETDLDIGHYERFLNKDFHKTNNFTTGQVYMSVIEKERKGKYLGKTIQIVPHIVDEIKSRIKLAGEGSDFLIVELGGTVGDIEGMPYLEAMRQMKHELGSKQVISIHVTLIPLVRAAGELKTKPTQHSVQELRRIGISPQILVARCERSLDKELKRKLAMSCDVDDDSVIVAEDTESIYKCPLNFLDEGILTPIARHLELKELKPKMDNWDMLVKKIIAPKSSITIGFVGKYLSLKESYKSLIESLIHAGANTDTKVNIKWIDSESVEENPALLYDVDSILVPGGFGERGIQGKLEAIRYAREKKIPFLGICLGMQLSLIEFARNVLGIKDADSVEFNPQSKEPIIYLIEDFIDTQGKKQLRTHTSPMGGTMRLGEYECHIKKGTKLYEAYGQKSLIKERHRHRYEANPKYRELFANNGMIISGECNGLIESIELENHPWFVAVQFHPEFTSRLQNPNPIILAFVKQTLACKKQ